MENDPSIEDVTEPTGSVADPEQASSFSEEIGNVAEVGPDDTELGDDEAADDAGADVSLSSHTVEDEASAEGAASTTPKRRKRRQPKRDAAELRLQGRRALCKRIKDIAPHMKKMFKLRALSRYLESTKGMNEADLTARIIKDAAKIADRKRILENLNRIDPIVDRRNLKSIIIHGVLLQEETHGLEENRLDEKVLAFEKDLVKRATKLDFFDPKKHDPMRWHHYDTYRIVLEAAWRNEDDISHDEAALLKVLRDHLSISLEEHWLIGVHINRFPKAKRALHTRDEINEARKELQRDSILWGYQDENRRSIDVLPYEVVRVIRQYEVGLELQRTNYRRILEHDSVKLSDLQKVLVSRDMDRYGKKAELVERVINADIRPSELLRDLDLRKLSEMCRMVGLKSSGSKQAVIDRLVDFYDDLTFEERVTQDEREEWYNNYELLAARAYSDLKAKKLITKDLQIEHQFEKATNFLFETKLNLTIDKRRKVTKADGRIPLADQKVILWDCKSVEKAVDLQDHLEGQFDGYLRKEVEKGFRPLAFMVIAPSFTPQSTKLAHQYKARTNWDVALVQADALKYLADQWAANYPEKPFPIGLFNRTEVIDKEKAEVLLSWA